MAQDLQAGTSTAPSFKDAVAVHRIIAAIEKAAESGSRIAPRSRSNIQAVPTVQNCLSLGSRVALKSP
jgi:hypothetical protein